MKKQFFFIILLWLCSLGSFAKHVPADSAQKAAFHFLQQFTASRSTARSMQSLQLVHQEVSEESAGKARTAPLVYYYVFSLQEEGGLIFVSADDKVRPILGYTLKGSYEPAGMPPHFVKWLENYRSEIRFAIQELPENEASLAEWKTLLEGRRNPAGTARGTQTAAFPLMSTIWDQAPYYNELCPYDYDAAERTVTGCVATAMAQIMKYWEYPATGSGFHSYNHEKYGTLSANFSSTTYDWQNMPNEVTGPNTAVATLMQHIGVSVDMGYDVASNGGSGAYVISSASPVQHCSEYALKTYFGYTGVQGVERENYELSSWINLLKTELNAQRPILYAGFGGGGGHAFVCDGYDGNDNFHMNWGWGGYYDGYYAISALNPGGVGTGGGTGGYNSGQQAVIGIEAPDGNTGGGEGEADLQLYADVAASKASIYYGESFSVHTDIYNGGTATFEGAYGAAAFDENGNFVDWVQVYENNELPEGYHYSEGVTFETEGLFTLLPGRYALAVYYKTGDGQWEQLKGNSFTESAILEVIHDNTIDLASNMEVEQGNQIYQGGEVSVTTSVRNKGTGAFSGLVDISLYNLDGSHVFSIEEKEITALSAGSSSETLTFQTSNLEVEPGTYLMAVLHLPENGDSWELTGSSQFTNPVKVIVQVAPLAGDAYEDNNDVSRAYSLPLQFSNSNAGVNTVGSSIHLGTDYDFYKVSLPKGSSYDLTVRVHDSYNSGDNKVYTNDVLFSVSEDGESWSDAFDDVLPSSVSVEGGKTVYFFVSPYFQGETGTYLLDVQVRQGAPTGIDNELPVQETVRAYPNPTSGELHIKTDKSFEYAELLSLTGQRIKLVPANSRTINLAELQNGMYLLRFKSKEGYQVQKIIKE